MKEDRVEEIKQAESLKPEEAKQASIKVKTGLKTGPTLILQP